LVEIYLGLIIFQTL